MPHKSTKALIRHLVNEEWHTFASRGARIAEEVKKLPDGELLARLDVAGIIPEDFAHDSTEEKLYAKYCDALLAEALLRLGLDASVTLERSDAADVEAEAAGYRLVADAKAFRLSRTAKNQKDFKIEALHQWKKGADYALLVSPMYQYPSSESQIYRQATTYGVTLLSYTHLAFLLRKAARDDPKKLRDLWEVPQRLPKQKAAAPYWSEVDAAIIRIAGSAAGDWQDAKSLETELIREVGAAEIEVWLAEKARIETLNQAAAKAELLRAYRIEERIALIRGTLDAL